MLVHSLDLNLKPVPGANTDNGVAALERADRKCCLSPFYLPSPFNFAFISGRSRPFFPEDVSGFRADSWRKAASGRAVHAEWLAPSSEASATMRTRSVAGGR